MTVLVTCTKCMTIWRQFSFKAQKTGSLYHRFNNNVVGIFICMTTWCYTLNNVVPQLRSIFKNPSYHNCCYLGLSPLSPSFSSCQLAACRIYLVPVLSFLWLSCRRSATSLQLCTFSGKHCHDTDEVALSYVDFVFALLNSQ